MPILRSLSALALLTAMSGCCCPSPRCSDATAVGKPAAEAPPPVTVLRPVEGQTKPSPARILATKRVKGLAWDEVNLDQVISYLRTVSGLEFTISAKAREEHFEDVIISAQLDDVSLETLLDSVITEPYELAWEARERVIWIITQEERSGDLKLRYFDLKDLAISPGGMSDVEPRSAPVRATAMTEIVSDIRESVSPGYWGREGVTMEARNNILIVRASREILREVGAYLKARRARRNAPGIPADLERELRAIKITVAFDGVSIPDAIKVIMIQSGRTFVIDPRIAQEVGRRTMGKLAMQDAALLDVMQSIAREAGRGVLWDTRDNVLLLTHRQFTAAR